MTNEHFKILYKQITDASSIEELERLENVYIEILNNPFPDDDKGGDLAITVLLSYTLERLKKLKETSKK